ncbi:MAG: hypothetical protein ABMB14_25325 [Myxococcota bacterium]
MWTIVWTWRTAQGAEPCDGFDTDGDPANEAAATLRGVSYDDPFRAIADAVPFDVVHLCQSAASDGSVDVADGVWLVGYPDAAGDRPALSYAGPPTPEFLTAAGDLHLSSVVLDGGEADVTLRFRGFQLEGSDVLVWGETALSLPEGGSSVELTHSVINGRWRGLDQGAGTVPTELALYGTVVRATATIGAAVFLYAGGTVWGGTLTDSAWGLFAPGPTDLFGTEVIGNERGTYAWGAHFYDAAVRYNRGRGIDDDDDLVLDATLVEYNGREGADSGGVFVWRGGTLVGMRSVIRRNTGGFGAGIHGEDIQGDALLVTENHATACGGGVGAILGAVRGVWIEGNWADRGGGVCVDGWPLAVEGGWVADNIANRGGGAYVEWGGTLTASGTSIVRNVGGYGGGVYVEPTAALVSTCTSWGAGDDDNVGWGFLPDVYFDRDYAFAFEDVTCSGSTCSSHPPNCAQDAPVPDSRDADGDGLRDQFEPGWGRDPKSADDDRNGVVDGFDPSWLAVLVAQAKPEPSALSLEQLAHAAEAARDGDPAGARRWLADARPDLGCDDLPAALGMTACDALNAVAENLWVPDGDGDGLDDRHERVWGLDPDARDTDGDGIADGSDPSWLADLAAHVNASLLALDPKGGDAEEEELRAALADDARSAAALTTDPKAALDRLAGFAAGLADCRFGDPDTGLASPCDAVNVLSAAMSR